MNRITEIRPGLYLGNGIHVISESESFLGLNINVVINCCDEIVHKESEKYIIEQYPINDDGLDDNFTKYADVLVDSIHKHLSNRLKVYIHCVQGISRSAAMIIYYLMKYEKKSFNKAYLTLTMIRSCIALHPKFIKELESRNIYATGDDGFFKIQKINQ